MASLVPEENKGNWQEKQLLIVTSEIMTGRCFFKSYNIDFCQQKIDAEIRDGKNGTVFLQEQGDLF